MQHFSHTNIGAMLVWAFKLPITLNSELFQFGFIGSFLSFGFIPSPKILGYILSLDPQDFMEDRMKLLQRIEEAVSRMDDSPYRNNLISKYWAISNGTKFKANQVAPILIAKVGGAFTEINIGCDGVKLNVLKLDKRTNEELLEVGNKLINRCKEFGKVQNNV